MAFCAIEDSGWVVVMTHANCEEAAEKSLLQFGYHVYLPRYRRVLHPHGPGRATRTALRPAFAGYLFVKDFRGWPEEPIKGIIGLMNNPGGRPVLIMSADIEAVHQREWRGEFDEARLAGPSRRARRDDLAIGDEVSVTCHGERILGVLTELSDNGKAVIETILFAGRLRVDAHRLVAAG
jgi:hypothetical protein